MRIEEEEKNSSHNNLMLIILKTINTNYLLLATGRKRLNRRCQIGH